LTDKNRLKSLVRRISKSSTLLLAATSLSLIIGLILNQNVPFMVGSAIGLGLSIRLVWTSIREGEIGSDVLALIAIIATSLIGEWLAASIIALMLATGRALESWATGRARKQLEALAQRAPRRIQLVTQTGEITDCDISVAKIGDTFLVRTGEVVPVDGRLVANASFDESALTGEPLPRERFIGDEVPSGVVNAGDPVELVATTTSESSTYAALVRLVENAKAHSAPGVRLANRYALWFVPLSLGLAAATWLITGEVQPAIAVIVAATPCPLILAIPIAIIAGISNAAKHGAIIKDGAALEKLARSQVLLVDKTGTLTHGGPEITGLQTAPGITEQELLRIAAGMELSSSHVLAKAVVRGAEAREVIPAKATEVREILGEGLVGRVDGHSIRVGRLFEPAPAWVKVSTALQICVDRDGEVIGVIDLNDPIREDSAATINELRILGVSRVLLVTGDRRAAAEVVGKAVGVDEIFAECRPEDKLDLVLIEKKKARGSVLVVGDGINDSPALAASDVGVAMGARGATAASETASVVIIEDSISRLADAIRISQAARARALQAAGLGMGLSLVAMLAGAFSVLSVTGNAIAQEFIDAIAILWALVPAKNRRSASK
jgi:heavy metal translocating P-type ATPase